jgi:hypothetical protein
MCLFFNLTSLAQLRTPPAEEEIESKFGGDVCVGLSVQGKPELWMTVGGWRRGQAESKWSYGGRRSGHFNDLQWRFCFSPPFGGCVICVLLSPLFGTDLCDVGFCLHDHHGHLRAILGANEWMRLICFSFQFWVGGAGKRWCVLQGWSDGKDESNSMGWGDCHHPLHVKVCCCCFIFLMMHGAWCFWQMYFSCFL